MQGHGILTQICDEENFVRANFSFYDCCQGFKRGSVYSST